MPGISGGRKQAVDAHPAPYGGDNSHGGTMCSKNLRAGSGRAVPGPAWPLPRQGPALRAAQSAYALCRLHMGCACPLPVPRHFLANWWQPLTFSVASPPMPAGLRRHWCGLPLVCATAYSTDYSTAHACLSCLAPRALARPSVETWRVGDANVYDGVQPRTLFA